MLLISSTFIILHNNSYFYYLRKNMIRNITGETVSEKHQTLIRIHCLITYVNDPRNQVT